MFAGRDTYIIHNSTPKSLGTGIKGIDGREIIVDPDYNKYKHTSHVGTVHALPVKKTKQYLYDIDINVGDQVLFHHFVCQPDHKVNIGDGYYRCEYFHIYGKFTDEGFLPIEDFIFVEPIIEKEEDVKNGILLMKSTLDVVKQQGIVVCSSKKSQDYGVKAGDKVFFTKSADYVIPVGDRKLYRMRIRNIVAAERDNKLICFKNKVLVKQIFIEEKEGVLLLVRKTNKILGEVIDADPAVNINIGDKINYFNGVNGSFKYKGEDYSFLDVRHINYLIQNNMSIPILDRVMIRQDAAQDRVGVLEIPMNAQVKPKRGIIVSVGPGRRNETDGALIPMQVKPGDRVIYSEFASITVKVEGEDMIMTREDELYLIL